MTRSGAGAPAELEALREKMYGAGSPETLRQLLELSAKIYRGRRQFAQKEKKETVYYTVDDFYRDVSCVGEMLMSFGGNVHAAVVGENSYYWVTAFFAATCSGNTAVPIDKELPDEKIAELAAKADCRVMFFSAPYSGAARLFLENGGEAAVCISGKARGVNCLEIGSVISAVEKTPEFEKAEPKKDDPAAIIFTSGTTGENKGVILTHGNLCSNFTDLAHAIKPVSTAMSVLPMNHVYELSCIVLTAVYMNALLYINDSLRHFESNMAEFRPEVMAAVPALLDSIYNGIVARAREQGELKKLFAAAAVSRFLMKLGIDIRRRLFSRAAERFGGKFPAISVGGAPVNGKKALFLSSLGFDIYVGYGLTETAPIVSLNTDVMKYPDSAGKCLPGCKIKLIEPDEDGVGEIAVCGRNVSPGYCNEPDADRRSFSDGWFLTGDYGKIGKNGELYIAGRKKNIIILDNGKNIYTESLEEYFVQNSVIIKEAVIFAAQKPAAVKGGGVKYLAMAVTADEKSFAGKTPEEADEAVAAEVARLNAGLPSYEKIADTEVFFEEFEKTSTMKIIRSEAERKYKERKKRKAMKNVQQL